MKKADEDCHGRPSRSFGLREPQPNAPGANATLVAFRQGRLARTADVLFAASLDALRLDGTTGFHIGFRLCILAVFAGVILSFLDKGQVLCLPL